MPLFELKTTPPRAGERAPLILYAEDNYPLAHIVKDVLELAGWRVRHCSDGSTAIALLTLKETYDLAIIDRELPHLDGLEVVRGARRQPHRARTPIILVSLEDCADEAERAGADAFLRKPQDLLSLVEIVRRLLEGGGLDRVSR
jgi:DNA-binding response OmpR family regulator